MREGWQAPLTAPLSAGPGSGAAPACSLACVAALSLPELQHPPAPTCSVPSYDPRTLYVPPEWLKQNKVSPGQQQVGVSGVRLRQMHLLWPGKPGGQLSGHTLRVSWQAGWRADKALEPRMQARLMCTCMQSQPSVRARSALAWPLPTPAVVGVQEPPL